MDESIIDVIWRKRFQKIKELLQFVVDRPDEMALSEEEFLQVNDALNKLKEMLNENDSRSKG